MAAALPATILVAFLLNIVVLQLAIVVPPTRAVTGVDVSSDVNETQWECMRNLDDPVGFAAIRVFRSTGSVDEAGISTIRNARNAGIPRVDGYLFPCLKDCPWYNKGAGEQVIDVLLAMKRAEVTVDTLWLDIEQRDWSPDDLVSNQNFVRELVDASLELGCNVGIYSNWNSWSEIVGDNFTYPQSKGLEIWYPHYDQTANFSDFKNFGGWTDPEIKQYAPDVMVCGADVDMNYMEDSGSEGGECTHLHGFKQCDSTWGEEELGTSNQTICSAGCAMSSVAGLLHSRLAMNINPSTLNAWLTEHDGYADDDLIVWASVDAMGFTEFQGKFPDLTLDELIDGVSSPNCGGYIANVHNGEHWVLVTGWQGDDVFSVADSGYDTDTYTFGDMIDFAVYK